MNTYFSWLFNIPMTYDRFKQISSNRFDIFLTIGDWSWVPKNGQARFVMLPKYSRLVQYRHHWCQKEDKTLHSCQFLKALSFVALYPVTLAYTFLGQTNYNQGHRNNWGNDYGQCILKLSKYSAVVYNITCKLYRCDNLTCLIGKILLTNII